MAAFDDGLDWRMVLEADLKAEFVRLGEAAEEDVGVAARDDEDEAVFGFRLVGREAVGLGDERGIWAAVFVSDECAAEWDDRVVGELGGAESGAVDDGDCVRVLGEGVALGMERAFDSSLFE